MSRPLLGTLVMETRSEFSRPTHGRHPTGPQPCCVGAPGSPLLRGSCSASSLYTELASVPPSAARQHPAESGFSGRTVGLGVEGWDFPPTPTLVLLGLYPAGPQDRTPTRQTSRKQSQASGAGQCVGAGAWAWPLWCWCLVPRLGPL